MIDKTVLRCKNIFNKIISDHWEEFKKNTQNMIVPNIMTL